MAQSIICFMSTIFSISFSPSILGNIHNKNKHCLSLTITPISSFRNRNLINKSPRLELDVGRRCQQRLPFVWRFLLCSQSRILRLASWLSLTSCLPFSPVTLHKPQIIQVRDEYLVLSGAYFIWRRKWQPTPVFLPRESYGQRSLAGYSPRGRKSLNHHKSNNRKGLNNRKTKPAPSPPRGHIHL